jgi:RNA polymerase sigma-70 factor
MTIANGKAIASNASRLYLESSSALPEQAVVKIGKLTVGLGGDHTLMLAAHAGAQTESEVCLLIEESQRRSMEKELQVRFDTYAEWIYRNGYYFHGDLQIMPREFKAHLWAIIGKYLEENATSNDIMRVINSLHGNDLYLAFACAKHSPQAWDRFTNSYQNYIYNLTASVTQVKSLAYELAENILADLFLPDRSGRSRIASYNGRSSLATWLRVIICHRAINEQERKFNNMTQLNDLCERADEEALRSIEMAFRSIRYQSMIRDSLKHACGKLTDRERLLLLLRYEKGLRLGQIGRLFGLHQANISRQLVRVQAKIRQSFESSLIHKYKLGQAAIDECLSEIAENPAYSILALIKSHR